MHIPSSASQAVALLPFEEALALSGRSGDYDAEKWLYVPDFYTEYRYILGTRGRNPLICIGINPSTAAPDDLDNTLKSVARIAAGNAYDSWIMFNVYAQRATRPDDMDRELNEHSPTFSPMWPKTAMPRPSGRPGARFWKSGPISPSACGRWCAWVRNTAGNGSAPGSAPIKGTPTTRCICARTKRFVLLTLRGI